MNTRRSVSAFVVQCVPVCMSTHKRVRCPRFAVGLLCSLTLCGATCSRDECPVDEQVQNSLKPAEALCSADADLPWSSTRRRQRSDPRVPTPVRPTEAFPHAERAVEQLDVIYQGHAHKAFFGLGSMARAREQLEAAIGSAHEALYGELTPVGLVQLLDRVGARPGHKYYDLGSGTGKTVMLAWLLGLHATGLELVDDRLATACAALERAKNVSPSERIGSANGLAYMGVNLCEADLSDADVVFANSVMFGDEVMRCIAAAASRMKPGTMIISAKRLRAADVDAVETLEVPTSWSAGSVMNVYSVTSRTKHEPRRVEQTKDSTDANVQRCVL